MITLISPSKTLDLNTTDISLNTQPEFQKDTLELVSIMKKKSKDELMKMMGISEKLAELNEGRYKNFKKTFEPEHAKQALLSFKGDVYTKIDVENYSGEEFDFAQKHLRILSGPFVASFNAFAILCPQNSYRFLPLLFSTLIPISSL